jgi:MFS transporter, ACS family, tartrate transporter
MSTTNVSDDREAAVARKVQRHIIPLLLATWFIAYIDRFNVSFAALQMNDALGLSAAAFGFGAGLFFVGYSVFEVPSNLILARVGARRWLSRIMISWGIVTIAMAATTDATSFYALRFLLGAAEAGCFPGMAFCLSQWLSPRERAAALGVVGSVSMISGVAGGPIAAALLSLDGAWGLAGWQWLFVVEGIPAIAIGWCVLQWLPDTPDQAAWLTSEEREWVRTHMGRESVERPTKESLIAVVTDGRYWGWAIAFMLASASGSAVRLFQPLILREVAGLGNAMASILTAVPSLFGGLLMIYVGRHSTRVDERRWHSGASMLVAATGVALMGMTYGVAGALLVACLASVGASAQPPLFATVSSAARGSVNAVGIAFVNSVAALGGFLGPYIVGYVQDTNGLAAAFLVGGGFIAAGGLLVLAVREKAPVPQPVLSAVHTS